MSWLGRLPLLIGILLVASACSGQAEVTHHPLAENVADWPAPSDAIQLAATSAILEPGGGEVGRNAILLIGVLDSPTVEVIGAIRAVAEHDGRLLILDGHSRQVRIHDRVAGNFLAAAGRPGRGPGEFVQPLAMAKAGDRDLIVADALGRISVFRLADSVVFDRSFRFPGDVWDACALGSELFLHGMRHGGSKVIHVYSHAGQHLRSFAEPYRGGSRIIRYQLSRGRIACLEDAGLVLFAPESLPRVFGYDSAGAAAWRMDIDGFNPMNVLETAGGGSILAVPDRPWYRSTALVAAGGDTAVLQIKEYSANNVRGPPQVHTWVLSPSASTTRYLGSDWPEILRITADRILATRSTPFPQLVVLERRGSFAGR